MNSKIYEPSLSEVIQHPQFVQEVWNIITNIDTMRMQLFTAGIKPNRSPFDTLGEKGITLSIEEHDAIRALAVSIYTKTCERLSSTERQWLKRLFDAAGYKVCRIIQEEKKVNNL